MYWANFLHIYQPPGQKKAILERVVKESYRKILSGLRSNPSLKLTLNLNAGLTEMLVKNGYEDVINDIRILLDRGQIELTGTAKYHPLLPQLPEEEIVRQIEINQIAHQKFFGNAYRPQGFFPPEMGYTPRLGEIIQKMGFSWVILDEVGLYEPVDHTKIHQNYLDLKFFFRERALSFKILSAQIGNAKIFLNELAPRISRQEYLVTAMDGETFGHHRPGLENLLWEIAREPQLPTVTLSQLIKLFNEKKIVEPGPSSWALTSQMTAKAHPFLRWDDSQNSIHQRQWQLVKLAIEAVKKDQRPETRERLDASLYSDQFWWASARPWWSLEMIEQGAHQLVKTIQLCILTDNRIKKKAKQLYYEIISTGFDWQRNGTVEEMAKKEDEEIRARAEDRKARLSPEDYNDMINTLRKQMVTAAENEEYHQAEQIKKRIEELIADRDNLAYQREMKVNE